MTQVTPLAGLKGFSFPEIREEGLGALELLDENVLEPLGSEELDQRIVLVLSDSAIDEGVEGCPAGRIVLGHETQRRPAAKVVPDPFYDPLGARKATGKDEMSDEKASLGHPAVERQIAHLGLHLRNRPSRYLRVSGRSRQAFGDVAAPILEIREIDIDEAVEELDGAAILVRVRVVHEGNPKTSGSCDSDGPRDLGRIRCRADEVDVMGPSPFEIEKSLCKIVLR